MVRTQLLNLKNDDAQKPHPAGQSMTAQEQLLAQAAVNTVNASASCLTCVRNLDQKYCYDGVTGIGQCCDIGDIDSPGCN